MSARGEASGLTAHSGVAQKVEHGAASSEAAGSTPVARLGGEHRLRKPASTAAEPRPIPDYPGLTPAELADCRRIRTEVRTALSQRPGLVRCSASAWALGFAADRLGVA